MTTEQTTQTVTPRASEDAKQDAPSHRNDRRNRAFRFADLSAYTFKQRCMIRVADLIFYALINIIGHTARFDVEGWEHFERTINDGYAPIHTLWHDVIYLSIYFWRRRGIVCMTSQSLDGEYIARFLQRFGFGAARGSSTRGGRGALVEMIRLQRAKIQVGFTVDGPQGPRRIAKSGAVMLAKMTGQPILPFAVVAESFWQVNRTWDKLQIPKPFTRAHVRIAPPIFVPRDADDAMIEAKRDELQRALDSISEFSSKFQVPSSK